jgi:hypothetical protein
MHGLTQLGIIRTGTHINTALFLNKSILSSVEKLMVFSLGLHVKGGVLMINIVGSWTSQLSLHLFYQQMAIALLLELSLRLKSHLLL